MPVYAPNLDELKEVTEELCMQMSDEDLSSHLECMLPNFDAYNLIDQLPDFLPEVKYSRTPGYQPEGEENRYNAWYRKVSIKGSNEGILKGKKVVLKDNICLSGVPMMNGTSTLEGYVPDLDASVVTRILDSGGEIVGKAHCEHFCLSGGSHTNSKNPVKNAHNPEHSSGGSSSGCGALVGSGEVEMAIGCDQGGSIRIPSSWNGCVGMKPTWGLVPYSGIMPIEATIDNAGPITDNVTNNALLLEAIAGHDGLDPRQYDVKPARYTEALNDDVKGLKIAVLKEGFGRPESEKDVDEKVLAAVDKLASQGAIVEEISLPWHNTGAAVWLAITLEGLTAQMMHGNGLGFNWKGLYATSLVDAHAPWRERADELSDSLKSCMLTGQYMLKKYRGRYYAKAQNLNRQLVSKYDEVLVNHDLVVMPTTPMKATKLPGPDCSMAEYIQKAFGMIGNTCQFDSTGHPAISVPCGMSDGLPVGMMMVGKHFNESTLYRAASALERAGDWRQW